MGARSALKPHRIHLRNRLSDSKTPTLARASAACAGRGLPCVSPKTLLCLSLAIVFASHAQAQPLGSTSALSTSVLNKKAAPTVVTADEIVGQPESNIHMQGKVVIDKNATKLYAPEADYNITSDELTAKGGVVLERGKDYVRAPELKINLGTQAGTIPLPEFFLAKQNGRGTAKTLQMSEWRVDTFEQVRYTTCKPGQDDWMLTADTMVMDNNTETGTARGAVLRFFDVPIFGLPYFEFPIGKERRSGWLNPTVGLRSAQGFSVSAPYYFNLAHNYDATVTPTLMTQRGLQVSAAGRYLLSNTVGDARIDYLPNDLRTKTSRWGVFTHHTYKDAGGEWSAGLNHERVSDDTYFADLTRTANSAVQAQLPTELWARYQPKWGDVSIRASQFQTLQDASQSVVPAYARLPIVSLTTNPVNIAGLDFNFNAEAARYAHPTLVQGNRAYAVPQLSKEWRNDWGYIKPTVAINGTYYSGLNAAGYGAGGTNPAQFSRTLPIASLDTGVTFERASSWFGKSATQTLEPRLYFLYVPFRDQSQFPNFDTSVSGFSFAQIFSTNTFAGQDRIADAKHFTPAITSRWLDDASGAELFKATLGRRFYINPQQVQLSGPSVATGPKSSDWLLALNGSLPGGYSAELSGQYDANNRGTVNSSMSFRYNPEPKRIVTLSKTFTKNTQEIVDLSWQWRVSASSAILGRVNYARAIPAAGVVGGLSEALLGYEYNADCWVFRIAANRYTPLNGKRTTGAYFQLDFTGLSQLGAGTLDTLKRNIPGYSPFENKPTWSYDAFRPF